MKLAPDLPTVDIKPKKASKSVLDSDDEHTSSIIAVEGVVTSPTPAPKMATPNRNRF